MSLDNNIVALEFVSSEKYPDEVPFDPPQKYPEYRGKNLNPNNAIYPGVRSLLKKMGLDANNFGSPKWNPLGQIIKPGETVFIKPNTVVHEHERTTGEVLALVVHASVLRPIIDYVLIALGGRGRVIIGDSQLIYSDFDRAMEITQIKDLVEWYNTQSHVPIECFDLRLTRTVRSWLYGRWKRIKVSQDPLGYQFINLRDKSCFRDIDPKRLRIAIASHKNMYKYHSNGNHQYQFPRSFLESSTVISISKLKTHRRTGVTLALKNFMGIPSLKDSLPHFITGSVEEGGDQYIYPSLRKKIITWLHDQIQSSSYIPVKFILAIVKKLLWNTHKVLPFRDDIYEAMWHGNDTLWRTLVDLNRAVLYADKDGQIRDIQQRNFLGIIDGIVAGEGNGPLCANCVFGRVLLGGFNPVALDAAGATLVGFDIDKIPLITKALQTSEEELPIFTGSKDDIRIIEGKESYGLNELAKRRFLTFEPHPNWKGRIELTK